MGSPPEIENPDGCRLGRLPPLPTRCKVGLPQKLPQKQRN